MAVKTKTAEIVQLPAISSGSKVAAIVPANWQEITAIAGAICRARMAPKSYCDRDGNPFPDKVAVAIMHGMEVGLTPMASLQSLAVINGMPGLYGDGLMAVVRASGQLEDLQEGLEVDDQGKPTIAWCKVKRKGEASWKERTLTYVECQRAGWTNKDGPWKLTPGRMMTVRVRGWLLRDMFADVLRGLHSAEELQDTMIDITPPGGAAQEVPTEPNKSDYVEKPKDPPPASPKPPVEKKRGRGKNQQAAAPETTPPEGGQPADTKPAATDVEDLNEKDETPITFQPYTRTGDFFAFADPWIVEESRTEAELVAFRTFYADYMNERLDPKFKSKAVHEAMLDTERVWKEAVAIATGKSAE